MGKVHGSLTQSGKVRYSTPVIFPQNIKRKPTGRKKMRIRYNKRFVSKN